MSNFIPDLAGWALSGGANREGADENTTNNDTEPPVPAEQESEEEIRAKRICRLSAMSNNGANGASSEAAQAPKDDDAMDVDTNVVPIQEPQVEAMQIDKDSPMANTIVHDEKPAAKPLTKKRSSPSKADPGRKLLRKKDLLLKKTLNVTLVGSTLVDSSAIQIDIGEPVISVENIDQVLMSRLILSPKSKELQSSSPREKGLVSYLAMCHKNVSEALSKMQASSTTASSPEDLKPILEEMKSQIISNVVSSLMEPDMFEMGKDGAGQLAKCLAASTMDPASSITIGVLGKGSSFYASLCDELSNRDAELFESVIKDVVGKISESLTKCETIMDSSDASGLVQISALTSLCSYKKAAVVVTKVSNFMLPPADSPLASERVNSTPAVPSGSTQQQRFFQMILNRSSNYLRRSGPALEKETLLGLAMRLGTPMDNPAISSQFKSPVSKTQSSVSGTTNTLRRQLSAYQDEISKLIRTLITAGEAARKPVRIDDYVFSGGYHYVFCLIF
jgi:hypothetical protein